MSYTVYEPQHYTATHANEAVQDDFEELLGEYEREMVCALAGWDSAAQSAQFMAGTVPHSPLKHCRSVGSAGQDLSCTKETAFLVIPGPWRESVSFLMCVRAGECFRVDTETDMLTDAEMRQYASLVREADRREFKSFVSD